MPWSSAEKMLEPGIRLHDWAKFRLGMKTAHEVDDGSEETDPSVKAIMVESVTRCRKAVKMDWAAALLANEAFLFMGNQAVSQGGGSHGERRADLARTWHRGEEKMSKPICRTAVIASITPGVLSLGQVLSSRKRFLARGYAELCGLWPKLTM